MIAFANANQLSFVLLIFVASANALSAMEIQGDSGADTVNQTRFF